MGRGNMKTGNEPINEPVEQAAEFSPGCSERSERNPGVAREKISKARFSGRQRTRNPLTR